MSVQELDLLCAKYHQGLLGAEPIKISPSETTTGLRNALAVELGINNQDRNCMMLYLLTPPIMRSDLAVMKQQLNSIDLSDTSRVSVMEDILKPLGEYFVEAPQPGVHIIFQMGPMDDQYPSLAPSSAAKPSIFNILQNKPYGPLVYCNRPYGASSTPVTILHPVFGQFVDDYTDNQLTAEDHSAALALSQRMSDIFPLEKNRAALFRAVFQEIFGIDLIAGRLDPTDYSTDGHTLIGSHCYLITEVKNEIGFTGAEPFFQASSYHHEYAKGPRHTPKYPYPQSRFPCFQLILFGSCLAIAGSVFGDRIHADVLTPILPLFAHRSDIEMWRMTARYLAALRRGLGRLRQHYQDLQPTSIDEETALYPYPTSFTSPTGVKQFQYGWGFFSNTTPRDRKLVFFGKLLQPDSKPIPICIKFTRRYSEDVHKFCASNGWAPRLLGSERLAGGWQMIVMEEIVKYTHLGNFTGEKREALIVNGLQGKLLEILHGLHAAGMVHGDFRDTNILVHHDVDSGHIDTKLVDFDWAGVARVVRYPANINYIDIRRPEGARDEEVVEAEHDMTMFEYLFPSS
ncbi:hypothetical protein FRB95_006358 [Tulasnella sp. JGI-2019a]|nr:hypothetical protein FRB95_006358 [Tulasnella sp. JGI-2019a]